MPRRFHRIQLAALERDLLSVAGVCDVFPLERIRNCSSLASLASCLRGCLNPLKKFGMPNFLRPYEWEHVAKNADRKRAFFAGNRIKNRNERRVGRVCAYQNVHRFRLAFEPSKSTVRTQGGWCGKDDSIIHQGAIMNHKNIVLENRHGGG